MKWNFPLLSLSALPLMAWTCAKQPYRPYLQPARVLRTVCPDTVNAHETFRITLEVRLSDCEVLQTLLNNTRFGQDTTWFLISGERDRNRVACDTTRAFVTGTIDYRFKSPGKQYLGFGGANDLVDSVYVR